MRPVRTIESERSRELRRIDEYISITKHSVVLLLILLLPFVGAAVLSGNSAGPLTVLVLLPAVELLLAGWLLFHLHLRLLLTSALLLHPLLCLLALLAFYAMTAGAIPEENLSVNPFAGTVARLVLLLGCTCSFAVLFMFLSVLSRIPRNAKMFLSLHMLLVTAAFLAVSFLHVVGHQPTFFIFSNNAS